MIEEEKLKAVLKETYLEIANEYDVSDLHYDSDKVSCVASRFRNLVLEKLEISESRKSNNIMGRQVKDVENRNIPKKPLCGGNTDNPTCDVYICPSCSGIVGIDYERANYCADCGQRLDWIGI